MCVVDGGSVQERSSGEIAGRPMALPMLAVHTVGAGGGSIAWRDAGGALRVARARPAPSPGPACYGRGGTEPTVTDANLVLGYLAADAPLGGGSARPRGSRRRGERPRRPARPRRPSLCRGNPPRRRRRDDPCARVVTVQRGIDPRRYALMAFGGAGGLHAAQIADELGIDKILCPRASGVLAALGLVVSPRRRDVQRSVLLSGDELTAQEIEQHVKQLGERARDAMHEPSRPPRRLPASPPRPVVRAPDRRCRGADPDELREAFELEHEERYGYRDADQQLELVTIRVTATARRSRRRARRPRRPARTSTATGARPRSGGNASELEVLRGIPAPGTKRRGPGRRRAARVDAARPAGLERQGRRHRHDPHRKVD